MHVTQSPQLFLWIVWWSDHSLSVLPRGRRGPPPGKKLGHSDGSLGCARDAPKAAGEGPARCGLPASRLFLQWLPSLLQCCRERHDGSGFAQAAPGEGRNTPEPQAKSAAFGQARGGSSGRPSKFREEAPTAGLDRESCGEPRGQRRGPKEGRMLPGCGGGKVSMATGEVVGLRRALCRRGAGRVALSAPRRSWFCAEREGDAQFRLAGRRKPQVTFKINQV